jgi:hypothetical protein
MADFNRLENIQAHLKVKVWTAQMMSGSAKINLVQIGTSFLS